MSTNPHTYKPNDEARIEAMRFTVSTVHEALAWADGEVERGNFGWIVHTLEGWVELPYGHYLIKGTHNEFYPCDPDVFEKRWVKC